MHMDTSTAPQLLGVEACLKAVFPDAGSAPSIRSFRKWMANRYFPVHKIGARVYLDPVEVRSALSRRFKINAVEAR